MENERSEEKMMIWEKPQIEVIDLKEYEEAIVANARTGGGSCGCTWSVGCRVFL